MMGYRRHSLLAILAAMTLAGGVAPSLADSRIFTARASVPGVTIDQAFRNGQALAIVGHGNGTTLFRIDSPSTPVGCSNRIDFVASTGERVEQVADMCALNWSVTVDVRPPAPAGATTTGNGETGGGNATAGAGGNTPAAAPGGQSETPGSGTYNQTVTVSTDDPSVTIISLSIDGEPVKITGREGQAVKFELPGGDTGIACERRIGLTLSDGRQIEQPANICLNNWNVVVALAGAGGAAGSAATAIPPAPPASTPSEPPTLPAPPST